MAHHAEPMDIDDEGDFDNKENTYQYSNVVPKTPSTEKGYEEHDVSELNMKLRYSITPAASPMSKSMSQCLEHRQNNLADESLNNTVINEYENNLTRSLNSTLNKTEVKSWKVLPLQALPTDVEGNRSSVLRTFDSATGNDITITVNNENEIDNLSFPSSSSSVAETPEATTPTKEIPKHDGGSPIMRGLKSVLSMFRSSQSPIPHEEEDTKTTHPTVSPADVPFPESKPRAVASTPKSENNKERGMSRRNSPHKESVVFNEDLEKELQWNDDSTIVFSTEKIPIHKLFFQGKPSKSDFFNESVKQEDANSTVEYMDVSYNDLSIKDRTLNGTVNRSRVNELPESDGEFVDCETTFTQNAANSKAEVDVAQTNDSQITNAPEKELAHYTTTVKEPFVLDTTNDIINSIDDSHIAAEGDLGKPIDFSTTDIVNRLSDLINESETSNDTVVLDKHEASIVSDMKTTNKYQLELLENQVTSPVNTDSSPSLTDKVSNENDTLIHIAGIVCHTIVPHVVSVESKISSVPVDADALITYEVAPQMLVSNEIETTIPFESASDNVAGYPSPVDIPLPNDGDINEMIENVDENVCANLQDKDTLNVSTSQIALMAALDKSIIEATPDVHHTPVEPQNEVIACPPNLLPSDVPLPNKDEKDSVKTNIPHEAITVASDPVDTPVIETHIGDIIPIVNGINDTVDIPITKTTVDVPRTEAEAESIEADILCPSSVSPSDIPLSSIDEDNPNETQDLPQEAGNVVVVLVSNTVKPDKITFEDNMEISFVESNYEKLSETMTIDVSIVNSNIKIEETISQSDTPLFPVMPKLTEIVNDNVKTVVTDIVSAENLGQNQDHTEISDSKNIVPKLSEIVNDKIETVVPVVVNAENVGQNDDNNQISDIKNIEPDKKTEENSEKGILLQTASNIDLAVNEKLKCESSYLPTLSEMATSKIEINIVDQNKAAKVDIVSLEPNEKEMCDVKADSALQHHSKDIDTTINVDSTYKEENSPTDEEIILSESNSPFVSMSAEEEFGSESTKEDFEKIDNPLSTKSKVAQSPPISPKIVSKGYNLNFDDIDTINAFATKTKIKMSPPPGASPNNSPTVKLNKTEIVESLKREKDVNRRKSMPERKKPLKAKRYLNSSVDSTEKTSLKTTPSTNDDVKIAPETQPEQEHSHLSQQDHTSIAASVEEANGVNNDGVKPSEIVTHEEKVHQESAPALSVNQPKDESERTEEKQDFKQNNEAKQNENVATSTSDKSLIKPDTSSSEQSTYFSAGASSSELTDSKNVFNLPELDTFNPFETKSKIRQSPSRDFDMDDTFATKSKMSSSLETSLVVTPEDCNNTVTIGNEEETKEDNCSGSSKTSDDKDATVHEVHTEDEDTLEGPFLEADDAIDADNIPELPDDKVDVVDFDNINQQDDDDAAEMFIDAEAFEFLMNQNKTEEVAYSGKESLFLKFDPLFARRVTSEGVTAALNDIKRKQNTPKKAPKQALPKEVELLSFEKPVAGPLDLNSTYETQSVVEEKADDMYFTTSKPMMAVTPAVNPVVMPRKSLTPNRSNRLSMTFTSPAMAVIDRLLSLSSNSSAAGLDTTVTNADRSHSETDQAITQLRELLAEKEIHVYNLRCETKELKDRLSTLETQMKALEAESAERLKKVNDLNDNLAEKTKMNRNMAAVVEEYERTIASLISETEQDKKRFAEERNQLIRDRDEQTAHLASMEVSFNDLHSKYEKSKQVIMGYKTNEEAYKKSIQEFEENLAKMHTNYELLKQHATSKLNNANQDLEKIHKAHEGEILKFNAMLKRKEVHITSLEESLAQKTKANEELTSICDELINKVG